MQGSQFKTIFFISYYGKPELKETTLFLHLETFSISTPSIYEKSGRNFVIKYKYRD